MGKSAMKILGMKDEEFYEVGGSCLWEKKNKKCLGLIGCYDPHCPFTAIQNADDDAMQGYGQILCDSGQASRVRADNPPPRPPSKVYLSHSPNLCLK